MALRYSLKEDPTKNIENIASERAFIDTISKIQLNKKRKVIYSTREPRKKYTFDTTSPIKTIRYYYQVRCNITHRGKAIVKDFELIQDCLCDMLKCFRNVLKIAKEDAKYP